MAFLLSMLVLAVLVGGVIVLAIGARRRRAEDIASTLADAQAEARRWVERLGGQVLALNGTDEASKQAIADAAERYTAAGSAMEQARTVGQCRLVTQTALEGLYYARAARVAMGMDPGPGLPTTPEQRAAGAVSEDRAVDVEGHPYRASREATAATPHYHPGGMVAGRPVPRGWYSEPWWRPALVAGAWGAGSMLLFSAMFAGMAGVPSAEAFESGHGADDGGNAGEAGSFDDHGGGDAGGDFGNDFGGGMDIF